MKRIGTLNGKVIVQGDPNLVTENQIHYSNTGEGTTKIILEERYNGSLIPITGGTEGESEYFKIKSSASLENLEEVISLLIYTDIPSFIIDGKYANIAAVGSQYPAYGTMGLMNVIGSFGLSKHEYYFEFSNKETKIFDYDSGHNTIKVSTKPKCTLAEFLLGKGNGADIETVNKIIDLCFEKVTKEEYESAITNK